MKFMRTTKSAHDRDPLNRDMIDKLMIFLKDRLSPEDFSKASDLFDDLQDDAEQANPSKTMATDSRPEWSRRAVRRETRNIRIGMAKETALAQDAARANGFAARFPDAARIKTDYTQSHEMQYAPRTARSPAPRVAMDAKATKGFEDRFPSAARIGHAD